MPMKLNRCMLRPVILVLVGLCTINIWGKDSDVVVKNDSLVFTGTFVEPDDGVARAIIVMATGSGSQDRDETIFGHRPFRAIADSLVKYGYASLRMDDRGVGGSSRGTDDVTTDDFAGDIEAAVSFARERLPDVPVGVLGHSEGGMIAVKLAKRSVCDFIVTMGVPAFRGDSVILRQVREAFEQTGRGDMFAKVYPELRERYDIAMRGGSPAVVEMQLYLQLMRWHPEYATVSAIKEQAITEVKVMATPWYCNFLNYDPRADIEAVDVPWLALNGSLDRQVTPDNLALIEEINQSVTAIEMPGLNHLMLKCVTGLLDEYERISGDIDPDVVEIIVSWLDALAF